MYYGGEILLKANKTRKVHVTVEIYLPVLHSKQCWAKDCPNYFLPNMRAIMCPTVSDQQLGKYILADLPSVG